MWVNRELGLGMTKSGVMGTLSLVRTGELRGDEGRAVKQDDKGLGAVNRWLTGDEVGGHVTVGDACGCM